MEFTRDELELLLESLSVHIEKENFEGYNWMPLDIQYLQSLEDLRKKIDNLIQKG